MTIIVLAGCVSASRHKDEIETIQYQKWQVEQKNQKLESDLVLQNRKIDVLLKDRYQKDMSEPTWATPVSKQGDGSLAKRLKSSGLEVVLRDSGPAVIISGLFESGSATLSPDGKKRLKRAGDIVRSEARGASFRIDGYTDNTSGAKLNETLSLKRAQAVRDFLVKECGFALKSVTTRGLGAENPIADNKTKAGRTRNRRIEIVVIIK